MIVLLQLTIVEFYFFGNSIYYLVKQYGDTLGCSNYCQENLEAAGKAFLGIAVLIIFTVPLLIGDEIRRYTIKIYSRWCHYTLSMVTVLIKTDMIYSLVIGLVQPGPICSTTNITFISCFIGIATVTGCVSIIVHSKFTKDCIYNEEPKNCDGYLCFAVVLLLFCMPFFLLSDNLQPLDCAFKCDQSADVNLTATDGGDIWKSCLLKSNYWASEASPTLGCSIEISRDIYMSVGRSVCLSWSKKRRRNYVGQTRACSKSVLGGKIRPILFISTIR